VNQNSVRGDRSSNTEPMKKKKVPGRRSGLRSSKKELPERRSSAFCHKNTPGYTRINCFDIMRVQDLTAASMNITAFCDVEPCSLVEAE
jgi:hypothetical protein